MLGHQSLVAFVPVGDLAAARAFYADVLGLRVTHEDPYAVVLDAGGTVLRLAQVDGLRPQPFTVAGWIVSDIEVTVDTLAAQGVGFVRYDGMDQDPKGIWTAPDGGRVAWFTDPDGNTLSLTRPS